MKNNKQETALIEVGKEVEKINTKPGENEISKEYYTLMDAIYMEDMKAIRKAATRLAALTIKFMVDEL